MRSFSGQAAVFTIFYKSFGTQPAGAILVLAFKKNVEVWFCTISLLQGLSVL